MKSLGVMYLVQDEGPAVVQTTSHSVEYKRIRSRTSRAEFSDQERMVTRVSKLVDAKK